MFINDLLSVVSSVIFMFADDAKIFKLSKVMMTTYVALQKI